MVSSSITLTSGSMAVKPVNQSLTPSNQSLTTSNKPLQTTPTAKATPVSRPQTPQSSTPGTWRHPRIDDIARRQSATAFTSENARSAAKNGMFFLVALLAPSFGPNICPSFIADPFEPYQFYILLVPRLFFLCSILYSLRPLLAVPDEMTDIPLTPSQRALLGLKPSSTPITPGSVVTPPRYSRSATPQSGAGSRSPFEASPLDGKRRSGSFGHTSLVQRGESPLLQQAWERRRESIDFSSTAIPGSQSPSIGAGKASVGLNSKWLYEKGRGSPTGRGLFS